MNVFKQAFKLNMDAFGNETFQAGCIANCTPANNNVFVTGCCKTNLCNNLDIITPTTTLRTTTTTTARPVTNTTTARPSTTTSRNAGLKVAPNSPVIFYLTSCLIILVVWRFL